MADNDYTTIALTPADKEELDRIGNKYIDGSFSYREVITLLIDELEQQETEYEQVLARAIAQADESDVQRVIARVNQDKAFVEEVSNNDSE